MSSSDVELGLEALLSSRLYMTVTSPTQNIV